MDIINGGKMVMLEDNCKTYLITGGEGFIGRKLVDKLLIISCTLKSPLQDPILN